MKKHGFTLSEVLIALGIIGIISAIGLPLINNARPDRNKIMYLKAYDSLTEAARNAASASSLFTIMYTNSAEQYNDETKDVETKDNVRYNIQKYPLLDYSLPHSPSFRDSKYQGSNKLCNIIKEEFSATEVNSCGTNGNFDNSYNFVTNNSNTWWKISPSEQGLDVGQNGANLNRTSGNLIYANLVEVDINGEEEPNSFEGTVNNPPDRFRFYITANGNVTPADAFGQAYLVNRQSLQKNKLSLKDPDSNTGADFRNKNITDIPDATIEIGEDIKAEIVNSLDAEKVPMKNQQEGANQGTGARENIRNFKN